MDAMVGTLQHLQENFFGVNNLCCSWQAEKRTDTEPSAAAVPHIHVSLRSGCINIVSLPKSFFFLASLGVIVIFRLAALSILCPLLSSRRRTTAFLKVNVVW